MRGGDRAHDRLIPAEQLLEGTTVRRPGDVGVLVVPREFAVEWGLVPDAGQAHVEPSERLVGFTAADSRTR